MLNNAGPQLRSELVELLGHDDGRGRGRGRGGGSWRGRGRGTLPAHPGRVINSEWLRRIYFREAPLPRKLALVQSGQAASVEESAEICFCNSADALVSMTSAVEFLE